MLVQTLSRPAPSKTAPVAVAAGRTRPRFGDQPHGDWRACMALAAVFQTVESNVSFGDHQLVPNHRVTWVGVRDLVRRRDGRPAPCTRLASAARAKLRYGMPHLDFPSGLWVSDLKDEVDPDVHAVQVAVARQLDASMTEFAKHARDPRHANRPLLPAWFEDASADVDVDNDPGDGWFPVPYLAFVARSNRAELVRRCGGFQHACPLPHHDASWQVKPSPALMRFAADCEAGLILTVPAACTYGGPAAGDSTLPVRHHVFVDGAGHRRTVTLPRSAVITAGAGSKYDPGDAWARLCPALHAKGLSRLHPVEIRRRLPDLFGGPRSLDLAVEAWLGSQVLMPEEYDGLFLFPAELAGPAVLAVPPVGLVWDFAPAEPYFDALLEAAVFPPFRQSAPFRFRRSLPGEVRADFRPGVPEAEAFPARKE